MKNALFYGLYGLNGLNRALADGESGIGTAATSAVWFLFGGLVGYVVSQEVTHRRRVR